MTRSNKTAQPLTSNQEFLRMVDLRIRGLRFYPNSGEPARIQAAREEIVSRMTEEELQGYEVVAASLKL